MLLIILKWGLNTTSLVMVNNYNKFPIRIIHLLPKLESNWGFRTATYDQIRNILLKYDWQIVFKEPSVRIYITNNNIGIFLFND